MHPPTAADLAAVAARSVGRPEAMVSLLGQLVSLGSHTYEPVGGAVVARLLQAELDAIEGLTATLEPSERFAPHVVAHSEVAAADSARCVALVGHLDTVFPTGSFDGFVRDGELARGPGVLDMKGGLVVLIEALRLVAALGRLADLAVRVVIVSDEEVGSPEGRVLIERQLAGARAALVLESGRPDDVIVTARKGTGEIRVVAAGKAAHAGNGHADGANAIWALARLVDRAQQLTDYQRGVTVNVGMIRGGQSRNTVPDQASAEIDIRFVELADGDALVEGVRRAAAEVAASLPGTSLRVEGVRQRPPLVRSEANVALYQHYAACARAVGLGGGEAPLAGGGSDASTTAALGIPSIDGLGPRGRGYHTHDEHIELASLLPKAQALALLLLEMTSG